MRVRKLLNWRSALIYTHRWVGVILTAVFVIWFVSGIVFMYVGMPTLPAEERLRRMEPLDLTALTVAPAEAIERLKMASPSRVRVAMLNGRPVYRIQDGAEWQTVYADTGDPLSAMSREDAMALMRRWVPQHASTLVYERRLTDSDQWTLQNVIRNSMPLHRIALNDAAGTRVLRVGADRRTGAAHDRQWTLLGISGRRAPLAVLHPSSASLGLLEQLRRLVVDHRHRHVRDGHRHRRLAILAVEPFPSAWNALADSLRGMDEMAPLRRADLRLLRVHLGLQWGALTRTVRLSQVLADKPRIPRGGDGGSDRHRAADHDRVRAVAAVVERSFAPKELDFFQFQGEPYFIAYVPPSPSETPPWRNSDIAAATSLNIDREHVLVSALRPADGTFTGFEKERMWDVAKAAMPDVPVQDAIWLNEYDAYYYSRAGMKPLPVLRIRYRDPQGTWLYFEPERGVIASRMDRGSRWNRWLYHGFHSLDFPFMYYKRPLWDAGVILLSIGGIAISVTSALPAWRRLMRHGRAWARKVVLGTVRGRDAEKLEV